jgi:predicted SnoaL-like aldol condensation-catalyzing enzyme
LASLHHDVSEENIMTFCRTLPLAVALAASACATADNTLRTEHPMSQTPSKRVQIHALLRSIETGEPAPVVVINPEKYIQHNLAVGDGLAGFGAVMQALPPGSARANPVRVFEDGDFVFAHTDYDSFGPKIGFDVFRFEAGRVVEHWDNLQVKPTAPNPSGHTMLDGATTPTGLEATAANKALVKAFLEDVLVNGKMDTLPRYIEDARYTQHNPAIGDGLSGLGAALQEMAKHGVTMKYATVHRVLGEGNFVLAMSEGTFGGKATSFFDLFRVEGGKIVEHWDTIESIPPRSEWKNQNGKF